MADSDNVAATPLSLNITFVESATVTGSFLFIAHAASSGNAQQDIAALLNTSSPFNTAFTSMIAAVFQSWLAESTSTYVTQLTAGLDSDSALVQAVDTERLGLFSHVQQPDVTVMNATIVQDITNVLDASSSTVTRYAYNVTVQVSVVTANLLSSVFVDVLNATASRRRLLAMPYMPHPAQQKLSHVPDAGDAAATSCLTATPQLIAASPRQLGCQDGIISSRMIDNSNVSNVSSSSSNSINSSSGNSIGSSTTNTSSRMPDVSRSSVSYSRRKLRATQSSSAFPLASLLMFKMDLTLAAFQGTSGCSTDNIADLFYDGEAVPAALDELCDGSEPDWSLSQALLEIANSSLPLLQV